MKAPRLGTSSPHIQLVEPVVERDAPLGITWLEGEEGRRTLKLMGVTDNDNKPSTLEEEKERVKGFIEKDDQLNWMIQFDDKIVGAIWVDLKPSEYLSAPSVHIMIGDKNVRGRGIGQAAITAVINYLRQQSEQTVYSRSLVENKTSAKLLARNGFLPLGSVYADADGLAWQNVTLHL